MADQINKVNKVTDGVVAGGGKSKTASKDRATLNLGRQYDQLNQGLITFVSTFESKPTQREIYQILLRVIARMNGEEMKSQQEAMVADQVIEEMERIIREHPDDWTSHVYGQGRPAEIIRGWKQFVPMKIKQLWG